MAGKPAMLKIDILTDATDAQKGIAKTGDTAKSAAGDFDALGQSIYNAMAHNGAQISDSAESMEKFGGAAGDASSGINAVATALASAGIADFTAQAQVAGDVLDGLEGATRLYTVATQIAGVVQKVMAGETKANAAAQWLLNSALLANPIALIILAVIALIGVIALLWVKSETFRNAVLAIWSSMTDAAAAVWDALKIAATFVLDFLRAYIMAWVFIVVTIFNGLKFAALAVWSGLKAAAVAVFNFLSALVRAEINGWVAIFSGLKNAALSVWTSIREAVSAALSFVTGLIRNAIEGWKLIFVGLKNAVSGVFEAIKNAVLNPITAIKDTIQALIDKVESLIGWLGKIKLPGGLSKLFGAAGLSAPSGVSLAGPYVPMAFGLGAPLAAGPASAAAGLGLAPIVVVNVSIGEEQLDARVDTRIALGNASLARRITNRAQVLR